MDGNDNQAWYLAGKMTWEPHFGFDVFDAASEDLRSRGLRIVSPAELDSPAERKAAFESPDGDPARYEYATDQSWGDNLSRDVKIVADEVGGVIVLPKWNKSRGARLETFVAFLCDKPIVHYPSLHPVSKPQLIHAWMGDDQILVAMELA